MSLPNPNPNPNPSPSPIPNPRLTGLLKQRSWSPDSEREEAWLRRKGLYRDRRRGPLLRRSRSVTDEDLDELRGCFDLGFGFDPDCPGGDGPAAKRLAETIPALDLFYAVHRSYDGPAAAAAAAAARSSRSDSSPSSSDSPVGSPLSILSPGDSPEMVKMRLKHWAQVVAWSVRHRS